MTKYIAGPKIRMVAGKIETITGWDYFEGGETATTYHEPDRDTWTGLYDHNGTPLHRQPEPIGYNPHRWSNAMPNPSQKQSKKSKPMKKGKGKGC